MKTFSKDRRARMALQMLERREAQFLKQRNEAVERHQWSQVSGYDGMATGIQVAIGILRSEFWRTKR